MNFDKFTIKSQEAIQKAIQIAQALNHPQIENVHILKAILEVDENVTPHLLRKAGADPAVIKQRVDRAIQALPKVSGGEVNLSRTASQTLSKAQHL
ncbi:MAG: type VI secretion system ATPase TssH, partial [Chlorobi bacterium]|nr:type VI secretion system ATPase TssH [Chlorobiota bacterium]